MRRIFLISLILLTACRKKEITCSATIYDAPGNIAFYGFNKSDLDTLIVSKYAANDSFTMMISTDTIISPDVSEIGGYLYADSTGSAFTGISNGYDLKIDLLSIAKTFYVHAIYSSQTTITWTEEGPHCSTVGTFVYGPEMLIANGNNVSDTGGKMYYFYLRP